MKSFSENRYTGLIFLCLFIAFLILSILSPMTADDFFHWRNWVDEQPLENVGDIIESMTYMRTHQNGRVIAHFLSSAFLMLPSLLFDIVNAFALTALFWAALRFFKSGDDKRDALLLFIFVSLVWVFIPAFGQVFLWLTGACNYSWTVLWSLLFVWPYYAAYAGCGKAEKKGIISTAAFCLFALLVGAYSENGSFAVLAAAACFMLLILIRDKKLSVELVLPFVFACGGFLFMMLSPSELGTKNVSGDSMLEKLMGIVSSVGAKWLILALLVLLAGCAVLLWLFIKHRGFFCVAGMICIAAVCAALLFLLAPGGEGLLQRFYLLLTDTKLCLVIYFAIYLELLLLALYRKADVKRILVALVFGLAAAASLLVFVFAVYFPARSSCCAAFYCSLGSAVLLSALLDMGRAKHIKLAALLAALLLLPAMLLCFKDVLWTYRQNLEREELLAVSKDSEESILLKTIICDGKYSVVWPREYSNFNPGIAQYYGVREVWVLDVDYA